MLHSAVLGPCHTNWQERGIAYFVWRPIAADVNGVTSPYPQIGVEMRDLLENRVVLPLRPESGGREAYCRNAVRFAHFESSGLGLTLL